MRKVYKYAIPNPNSKGLFSLELPIWHKILKIDFDPMGAICMWVEFPAQDEKHTEQVDFKLAMTGEEFDFKGDHIGSVVTPANEILGIGYVYHFYKAKK
jgi:hypothetical protein